MNGLFWLIFCLSMFSLLYYFIITAYAGFGASFSWFWLIAGLAGVLVCLTLKYMLVHNNKAERIFSVLITVILVIGLGILALIDSIVISHTNRKAEMGVDYIIVLGAQIRGNVITKSLRKRLDTAAAYLKKNPDTKAVVSGGRGKGEALTEAEAMKQYLIRNGISKDRIIKEDKSRNTFENILYSKPLLKPDSSAAIVTNGFHIFRSVHIARKQGLTRVQGLAAPTDRLLAVNYYVREAVGVLKDKLLGNL